MTLATMEINLTDSRPSFSALSSSVMTFKVFLYAPTSTSHPVHTPTTSSSEPLCYKLSSFLFSCSGPRRRLLLQTVGGLTGTPSSACRSPGAWRMATVSSLNTWHRHVDKELMLILGTQAVKLQAKLLNPDSGRQPNGAESALQLGFGRQRSFPICGGLVWPCLP